MSAPLVFVHGMFGAASDWSEVRHSFPGARALDLPAHGDALHAPCASFSDAVEAVLAQTAAGTALVGYSLGARVALAAALHRPGHFRALVLESATAGIEDDAEREERLILDDARAEALQGAPGPFLMAFWKQPLFATLDAHPRRAELLEARIARAARDPVRLAEVVRALSVARQPNLWPELASVDAPTLVVAGGLDAKYRAFAARLEDEVPDCRACVLENAGHNTHLESPAAFVAVLGAFLSGLKERAA